jgi:ribose-phosphate pyrophosphokinase
MIALPNVKEETVIEPLVKELIQVTVETEGGLGYVHRKTFQFSAGETQVRLSPLPTGVRKIRVRADIESSQTLVELLLTLDAINNLEYQGPVGLTLPYLPYSRQDRACAPGEAFALSVLVNCLVPYLGADDTITTWDVHSSVARTLFDSKFQGVFYNVSAASLLQNFELEKDVVFNPSTIVIAPDKGAVDRATEVQNVLGLERTVYATKVRNPDDGQILRTEVPEDVNYRGKNLLIVDDICDGGRTFIELAKVLREYEPSRIDLYVTHGIFSKGFKVFEGFIDNIYVANLLMELIEHRDGRKSFPSGSDLCENVGCYREFPSNVTYLRNI